MKKNCLVCKSEFTVGGRGNPPRTQKFCGNQCKNLAKFRIGSTANQLSLIDMTYLAGLLDGEGSIMLHRPNNRNVELRMYIGMTDYPIMEWLQEVTGVGSITFRPPLKDEHSDAWAWTCNADAAESIIRQVIPYLKIKRNQAELALAFRDALRHPELKADHKWQELAREEMKFLNKKGQTPLRMVA